MNIKWVEGQKKNKHRVCGNVRRNVSQSRVMDYNDPKRTSRVE